MKVLFIYIEIQTAFKTDGKLFEKNSCKQNIGSYYYGMTELD